MHLGQGILPNCNPEHLAAFYRYPGNIHTAEDIANKHWARGGQNALDWQQLTHHTMNNLGMAYIDIWETITEAESLWTDFALKDIKKP